MYLSHTMQQGLGFKHLYRNTDTLRKDLRLSLHLIECFALYILFLLSLHQKHKLISFVCLRFRMPVSKRIFLYIEFNDFPLDELIISLFVYKNSWMSTAQRRECQPSTQAHSFRVDITRVIFFYLPQFIPKEFVPYLSFISLNLFYFLPVCFIKTFKGFLSFSLISFCCSKEHPYRKVPSPCLSTSQLY